MYTSPITTRMKRRQSTLSLTPSAGKSLDENTPGKKARMEHFQTPTTLALSGRPSGFETPMVGGLISSLHSSPRLSQSDVDVMKMRGELSRLQHKLSIYDVEIEAERAKHKA